MVTAGKSAAKDSKLLLLSNAAKPIAAVNFLLMAMIIG